MPVLRSIAKAILPPQATIRLRAAFKRHEPERALLPALCDPARLALDIGAALGAYSWPLSRLSRGCVAFEPNPEQAEYLRKAFGKKLRVENCALSDLDGEVDLVIPLDGASDLAGQATIGPGRWLDDHAVRRQTVPMRTLDSFGLGPAGFIKLDVEGHELAVLKGGRSMLECDQPVLLVELEERFGEGTIGRVRAFMEALGYRGLFLDGRHLHTISVFDPSRMQKAECWGEAGAYINNFIFILERSYPAVRDRLSEIGYLAPA